MVGANPTMNKENKLINKVKRLLKRLGMPRWLHHFGPKKYQFYHHFAALLIRFFCQLSYRRVKQLLDLIGMVCPTKSALQYTANKLDSCFWNKVLKITCGKSYLIAIDSTGFSRSNPSYHYLKRIDRKIPKVPIKVSMAFDTGKKKFSAAKIRVLPSHDIRDAKYLLEKSKPSVFVADKAYDSNWIHEYCQDKNIEVHIPIRQQGKSKHGNWNQRRKDAQSFKIKTYHRRELAESGNSSIKRKFGSSVNSKKAKTIRTEIYGRLTCHNIFICFSEIQDRATIWTKFI